MHRLGALRGGPCGAFGGQSGLLLRRRRLKSLPGETFGAQSLRFQLDSLTLALALLEGLNGFALAAELGFSSPRFCSFAIAFGFHGINCRLMLRALRVIPHNEEMGSRVPLCKGQSKSYLETALPGSQSWRVFTMKEA